MAYVKTNWVNNTTPIDENNLNKIEQGIYDNSLITEAIADKLNPTDTETYKTAELTEGQITDVIGVKDIIIKGQTSQNGTPTPDSPVDVNVVSGSNVINTSNKNILDLSNYKTTTQNGITLTPVFQGNRLLYIQSSGTYSKVSFFLLTNDLKLKPNTTYSLKGAYSSSARLRLREYDSSANQLSEYFDTGSGVTFTSKANVNYVNIQIVFYAQNNAKFYPMLEQSSTATTYEPHQDKELPLDLPVENLFNKNNAEKYTGFTNGSDYKVNYNTATKSIIIPCKENTTYTVSKINGGNYDRFNIASFTTKPTTGTIASKYVGDNSLTSLTITTGPNDTYIMVLYYHTSETVYSENDILDSIQIEKGSKANAYTPYGTAPIELCKIGDYQDYFYKSGSKWYLHKEIEKIILNGTENWIDSISQYGGVALIGLLSSSPNIALSNILKYQSGSTAWTEDGKFGFNSSGVLWCKISNTINSLNDWKAYLNSNNMIIYYHKYSHTDTEITDTTLIYQLEAIYNTPLYEQTNITQTNNDLPMVLDITACKDNINGIKAFIRK